MSGLIRSLCRVRAVRHGLVTTALVLAVCAAVAGLSAASFAAATAELRTLTARAQAEVTAAAPASARVAWTLPDGRAAVATVPLAGHPLRPGTRTEVAYDPARPDHAVIPGAALLAGADRAAGGMAFAAVVALAVLAVSGWRLSSRARLTRRPATTLPVRRVRVQRGLITRSWLETERGPRRWVPVYFDPALVALPSPATVRVFGDPAVHRLVAAQVGDVTLYPSGAVVRAEPRGRRTDNPARPDEHAAQRGEEVVTLRRQWRADAALLVPAPFVGLFWSYLDGSGATGWLGATVVTAVLALWWAAIRGSDPS
ncbi:DUF3592 domain-containing protein [Gandjariella thermophila]|uniref:DUF3592 domain-containing protein n=1 Tax=Gandjariella thermophila TaxID=1931992 RepID=A0A4D4JFU3_9PSEU|nr:DUF3592 domain-containing protein [Gandjariella thermophila]GDY33199.1 hypothetical protein GTS_48320 [Gandjariella thermophila]